MFIYGLAYEKIICTPLLLVFTQLKDTHTYTHAQLHVDTKYAHIYTYLQA